MNWTKHMMTTCEVTRVTKSRIAEGLLLIGWNYGAGFYSQSQIVHIIHREQYLSLHYCRCCFYLLACHFFIPSVSYDYIGTLLSETIWDSFKAGFFSYWKWNKECKSHKFIKQLNNVMDTEPSLCTATPSPQTKQGKYNFNWHNQRLLNNLAMLDLNT